MGLFGGDGGSSRSGYGGGGGRGTGTDGGGGTSGGGDGDGDRSRGNTDRSDSTTNDNGPVGGSGSGTGDGGYAQDARDAQERQGLMDSWAETGQDWGSFLGSLFGPGGKAIGGKIGGYTAEQLAGIQPPSWAKTGYYADNPQDPANASWGGQNFGAPRPDAQNPAGTGTGQNFGQNLGQGGYQGPSGGYNGSGQTEMERQDAFLQYAGGLYHPSMQRGEQASSELYDYYSGNQQPMQDRVNQSVMNSPFLAQNIAQGEDAIARNRQATGGFRSGTTQENLAQNAQNQYQNMYNQQLNQNLTGLGMFGDYGANALNNYSNFGSGMITQIGTTAGSIASQNIAKEANKQNQQNAWINAAVSGLGSYFGEDD